MKVVESQILSVQTTVMKFLFILSMLMPLFSYAEKTKGKGPSTDFHVLIEPVLGYQFIKRSYPYAHQEGMFIYGARAVVGSEAIAGEILYTHGSSTESFTSPSLTTETSRDIARLGLRRIEPMDTWIDVLLRAGWQASHDTFKYVLNGVSSTNSPKWEFHPYVGLGLLLHFIPGLAFDLSGTYIFTGDLETGMGFRFYI